MNTTRAHAASLPLYTIMNGMLEGDPVWVVAEVLHELLAKMGLHTEIEVAIIVRDDKSVVDLQKKTDYGEEVLQELKARSSFSPCPNGECEEFMPTTMTGFCKWCGSDMRSPK